MAIQALTFIAADPDRLGRFLAATGIGPGDIRAAAREPLFLAGVLDHIAGDEKLLLAFAGDTGIRSGARSSRARERARRQAPGERDVP